MINQWVNEDWLKAQIGYISGTKQQVYIRFEVLILSHKLVGYESDTGGLSITEVGWLGLGQRYKIGWYSVLMNLCI